MRYFTQDIAGVTILYRVISPERAERFRRQPAPGWVADVSILEELSQGAIVEEVSAQEAERLVGDVG